MSAPFAKGALTDMLQRGENARRRFVAMLQESAFGSLSEAQAEHVLALYLKHRIAKIDHGVGQVNVRHGAYLNADALRRAAAMPL